MSKIITLTTDFGNDAFALAQMKAVIYGINPLATIVDCASHISSFNLIEGAFILSEISQYFNQAVHIGVVDPGVGSSRKPIIVETAHGFFVGPDNGLLIPAAERSGQQRVLEIDSVSLGSVRISNTFHGRDIFSRVAAHLTNGVPLEQLTKQPLSDWQRLTILPNQIVFIDPYGNIKINHPASFELGQKLRFRLANQAWREAIFCRTFSEVATGEFLLYLGSNWNLELAINLGSAAQVIRARVGDILEVES